MFTSHCFEKTRKCWPLITSGSNSCFSTIHIIYEQCVCFQYSWSWKLKIVQNLCVFNFASFLINKNIDWTVLTTWTKASPMRCNGSQISRRPRNSSRNCWWTCKMVGTIKKISSTVWLSMSDAFSGDFNGFKYFYGKREINFEVFENIE